MGRISLVAILALIICSLGACSDTDWENAMTYLPMERGKRAEQVDASAQAAPVTPPVVAGSQPAISLSQPVVSMSSAPVINEHCRALATQRASDGQYMGMDEDAQKQEYDRTYADCATWDAAHRY